MGKWQISLPLTFFHLEKVQIKILKQVEYESARRKRHINKKTRKRDEEGSTLFYVHLPRELEGTRGNSRELEGTRGNSSELEGT